MNPEGGTFQRMTHIRSHECVAITPPAEFGYRVGILLKPMSVQGIPSTRLGRQVEGVHDARIEQGFANGRQPAEVAGGLFGVFVS